MGKWAVLEKNGAYLTSKIKKKIIAAFTVKVRKKLKLNTEI